MTKTYLVGYDICHPRRLAKVYRTMCSYATPIGFSVFLLDATPQQLEACINKIITLINPKEDDVRFYALPKRGTQIHLGTEVLPAGIVYSSLLSRNT